MLLIIKYVQKLEILKERLNVRLNVFLKLQKKNIYYFK